MLLQNPDGASVGRGMKLISRTLGAFAIAFAALALASLIAAAIAATSADDPVCAFGRCLDQSSARLLAGIGALSGLLSILCATHKIAGAALGAGVVLAGIVAGVAFSPPLNLGATGDATSSATTPADSDSVTARMARAREAALDLGPIGEDLPVRRDVSSVHGGLAVVSFTLQNPKVVAISVSGPGGADPLVILSQRSDDDSYAELDMDDDSGDDGRNARLEIALQAGDYRLELINLRQRRGGAEIVFDLKIEEFSPESATNVAVTLDAATTRRTELKDQTASRNANTSTYRLEITSLKRAECLVVAARPTARNSEPPQQRDTVLTLKNLEIPTGDSQASGLGDGPVLARNDDWTEEHLGSRVMRRLEPPHPPKLSFIVEVEAYSNGTKFDLTAELTDACPEEE